jgi:hypothetical protein
MPFWSPAQAVPGPLFRPLLPCSRTVRTSAGQLRVVLDARARGAGPRPALSLCRVRTASLRRSDRRECSDLIYDDDDDANENAKALALASWWPVATDRWHVRNGPIHPSSPNRSLNLTLFTHDLGRGRHTPTTSPVTTFFAIYTCVRAYEQLRNGQANASGSLCLSRLRFIIS